MSAEWLAELGLLTAAAGERAWGAIAGATAPGAAVSSALAPDVGGHVVGGLGGGALGLSGAGEPAFGGVAGLAVLVASGLVAGFVNTVAGGGSFLTVPALMLLGLPIDVANGTNRVGVFLQSVAGTVAFRRGGAVELGDAPSILVPSALGAVVGARVASVLPLPLLQPLLLGSLVLMALAMALSPSALSGEPGTRALTLRERPAAALGLFVAGLYAGFAQAGVGYALIAVLGGVLRYDLVRANALKLVVSALFGGVALVVFALAGKVAWVPGLVLAAATMVGSTVGVRFATSVPVGVLRWMVVACLGATIVGVALKG